MLDEHTNDEFQLKDTKATTHTMAVDPYLIYVPTPTGGTGYR